MKASGKWILALIMAALISSICLGCSSEKETAPEPQQGGERPAGEMPEGERPEGGGPMRGFDTESWTEEQKALFEKAMGRDSDEEARKEALEALFEQGLISEEEMERMQNRPQRGSGSDAPPSDGRHSEGSPSDIEK